MFRSAYEFFKGKDPSRPDIPPEMLNVTKLGSLKRNSSSSDLTREPGLNLTRVKSCPTCISDPYPNPYPNDNPYPDQHPIDLTINLYPQLDSAMAELMSLSSLDIPEVSVISASTGSLYDQDSKQVDDGKEIQDQVAGQQQNIISEENKESDSSESEEEEEPVGVFTVGSDDEGLNDEESMRKLAPTQSNLFRTVSLASMASGNSEHKLEGKPDRLNIQFKKDVARVVELVLALPDNEEKHNILKYVLRNLNNLRTEVTINTHFAILSTLLDDKGDLEKKN